MGKGEEGERERLWKTEAIVAGPNQSPEDLPKDSP